MPETSPLGLYSDRTALKRHTDPALPFRSRAVVDHCSGRHFACRAIDRFLVFIAVGARRIRGRRQVDQPSVRLDLSAGQRPTVHLVPRSVQADVDAADERFLSECMVAKIGDEQQRIDWASLYARRFQFVDKPISTARAQEKLGLSSRAELAAFFAQSGLRRKLAEVALAGEHLLIGAYPQIEERTIAPLTEAERDIVALVVAGSTNADIARRRGSSEHTVASQLQSIFRKLRVRSRSDLAVRLQSGAETQTGPIPE